jgi:uncharacterized DUF497 family protein
MPPTIDAGDYEWDADKAATNWRKHRVSFEEAATGLAHPRAAVIDDGSGVGVLKAIGVSRRGRLLTVVFVEARDGRERIVSAWKATREERKLYMTRGA